MNPPGVPAYRFPSREFKASRWNMIGSGVFFAVPAIVALLALSLMPHSKGFRLEMDGLIVAAVAFVVGIVLFIWGIVRPLRTLTISDTTVTLWRGSEKWKELEFADIQETYLGGRPTIFKNANPYAMRDSHGNRLVIPGIGTYEPLNLVKAMLAERLPAGVAPESWMDALNDLT